MSKLQRKGIDLMKAICKESVTMKNGHNKGEEVFTEGQTYMIVQNGLLVNFYGLGDITLCSNSQNDHSFSTKEFHKHFVYIF